MPTLKHPTAPRGINRYDLTNGTIGALCEAMETAVRIGAHDATMGYPPRTRTELRDMLIVRCRTGHLRGLKEAYSIGFFHIEAMGKP